MELMDLQQILEIELSKPLESIDADTVADLVELTGGLGLPAELAEKRDLILQNGRGLG